MHDFMLDENARTAADDLLDKLLVTAHTAVVDAIAAQQYRSTIAEVVSSRSQSTDVDECDEREFVQIKKLMGQATESAAEPEVVFAGPALGEALDALERLNHALRDVPGQSRFPDTDEEQMSGAVQLVEAMVLSLKQRTASQKIMEESFATLSTVILQQEKDRHAPRHFQTIRSCLARASQAVDYLFDASDDFEGAPA